jgi:hypothetical protein
MIPINSYNLMHNQASSQVVIKNKRQGLLVRWIGACPELVQEEMLVMSSTGVCSTYNSYSYSMTQILMYA